MLPWEYPTVPAGINVMDVFMIPVSRLHNLRQGTVTVCRLSRHALYLSSMMCNGGNSLRVFHWGHEHVGKAFCIDLSRCPRSCGRLAFVRLIFLDALGRPTQLLVPLKARERASRPISEQAANIVFLV